MIYLDWNASTPVHPEVRAAIAAALEEFPANPSSAHAPGRRARAAVEAARQAVAALIEARPEEIVFTAGGSEANNLAIAGALALRPGHVVAGGVEHPSVADCAKAVAGSRATFVAPGVDGVVAAGDLERAMTGETTLVTLMRAQNETGVLQPVAEMAAVARRRGILAHTDAVQAAGKTRVSVRDLGVDLLSLSAHKMRGPKGAGALYIRDGVRIAPIIHGGGHERGLRGGTENVIGIIGLGKAAEVARRDLEANTRHAMEMRDRFEVRLAAALGGGRLIFHGARAAGGRLGNTSCLSIAGASGHALMMRLDERGIAISTGSACHAGVDQGSAILLAMGVAPEAARGALRVSFGPTTRAEEVDQAVAALREETGAPGA